jgi:lipoate-protein ligase A
MAEERQAAALHWLPTRTMDGASQMAIDAWLLEQVAAGARPGPVVRFYRWRRPTLSLGKHQSVIPPNWWRLVAAGRLDLVRRPTGGSAVLHGGDLTYALIWPDPPRRRREAYRLCCRWLQEAFAELGQPLHFGDAPCRANQANCFANSTAADLVHANGQKRIGSAQLWRGGSLLQHGSVLVNPDPELWERVFGVRPLSLPPLPLGGEALEAHLLAAAQQWFPSHGSRQAGGSKLGWGSLLPEAWFEAEEWEAILARKRDYEVEEPPDPAALASAIDWATDSRGNPGG